MQSQKLKSTQDGKELQQEVYYESCESKSLELDHQKKISAGLETVREAIE